MTRRAGYVMKYPDGRVIRSDAEVLDTSKALRRQVTHFDAKIKWGPVILRRPAAAAPAEERGH